MIEHNQLENRVWLLVAENETNHPPPPSYTRSTKHWDSREHQS